MDSAHKDFARMAEVVDSVRMDCSRMDYSHKGYYRMDFAVLPEEVGAAECRVVEKVVG